MFPLYYNFQSEEIFLQGAGYMKKKNILPENDRKTMMMQWCIQRFFGITIFSRGFQGRSPKWHNRELWRIIFSYKHVWMAWVGAIYYEKCNDYVLINCIRLSARGEFIQNYFKSFGFLSTWNKNLGSHTSWLVAESLWIYPWNVIRFL